MILVKDKRDGREIYVTKVEFNNSIYYEAIYEGKKTPVEEYVTKSVEVQEKVETQKEQSTETEENVEPQKPQEISKKSKRRGRKHKESEVSDENK